MSNLMTDTTDIKALREAAIKSKESSGIANYRKGDEAKRVFNAMLSEDLIIKLLDQLEAERQRADYAVTERNTALKQASAARNGFDEQYQLREKAEAELAVLKAKLANPVVLSDCSFEAVSHMAHWYSEGECVAWVSGAEHVKKQILEAGFTVKGE